MESVLLQKVESFATKVLREGFSPAFIYHNFDHTLGVVRAASTIGNAIGLSDEEMEIILIAAWFHDLGYKDALDAHEEAGGKIAGEFLEGSGYGKEKVKRVQSAIAATKMPQMPLDQLEEVLCDADMAHLAENTFMERSVCLRKEWEVLGCAKFQNEQEWLENNLRFLKKHQYFTEYGMKYLQKGKDQNILEVQNALASLA